MRVKPTPLISIALLLIYMAVVAAIWAINGVDYDTVADTSDTVLKGIVIPIGVGAVLPCRCRDLARLVATGHGRGAQGRSTLGAPRPRLAARDRAQRCRLHRLRCGQRFDPASCWPSALGSSASPRSSSPEAS